MVLYKITNLINNKIYIGQYSGKNFESYWGSGKLIRQAIKKYGKENFKKEIIEICLSKQQLNEREIYWIDQYNSIDKDIGYNISLGGFGGDLGEEVNKKRAQSLKGNTNKKGKEASKETKIKQSLAKLGKHRSEESKIKQGNTVRGSKRSEIARANMSNAMLGKNKGKVAWNRGLTKDTDERVKQYGEKESKTKRGL